MEGSGGHTKEHVSGWTVDTLHSHISTLLQERHAQYMAKFESAQLAVDKSEDGVRQWQATANEWRGAMQDKDRLLMSRPEVTSELNALRTSVATIRSLSLSAILVCCAVITVILLLIRPHS